MWKKKKFQQLTEFERRRIIGFLEEGFFYRAIAARVQRNISTMMRFWGSGPSNKEQLKKLTVEDERWRLRTTIDTCSAWRWMTIQLLKKVDSKLVYCYMCTNVRFANLLTSAAPWIAPKGVFMQDSLYGKPSTAESGKDWWAQSQLSWLASSCLFRCITF